MMIRIHDDDNDDDGYDDYDDSDDDEWMMLQWCQ